MRRERLENTLAAFRLADRAKCDGIELDVHALADGTPVVNHDPSFRIRGRRHYLSTLLPHTLRDLTRTPRMPPLAHVIAWARTRPRLLVNIEIKDRRAVPQTIRLARRLRPGQRVITSFHLSIARAVKRSHPSWRVGWIQRRFRPGLTTPARRPTLDLVVMHSMRATRSRVTKARALGLDVWVWGINSYRRAKLLAKRGVSAFITDAPRAMLQAFRSA